MYKDNVSMSTKADSSSITIKPHLPLDKDLSNDGEVAPTILCLKLSPLSPTARFTICSVAIFVFYLIYGYMLELVFHIDGMKKYGWLVTLIQFCYYSFFALVQLGVTRQTLRTRVPLNTYIIIALLTVGTMGFSNSSMGYLNYPTQVIFKSCKLIPVMVGSILILNRKYTFAQVLACLVMCVGLVWFTLADSAVQPNFDLWGVFLVCMSLCCDAIIGNVQEGALRSTHESGARLVLYSYSIGFIIIAVTLLITGELVESGTFVYEHAWSLLPKILLLSCAGFCGVQAVLALVALYGALAAVTVTTARKAISILLSFAMFTKPFTLQYVWGGVLVVGGIYLNLLAKQPSSPLVQRLNSGYNSCFSTILRRWSRVLERTGGLRTHEDPETGLLEGDGPRY